MKKIIFTLLLFCAAFMAANAQEYLLKESFDSGRLPLDWTVIDADKDGYNWDAATPFTEQFATHSGNGCISSASFLQNSGKLTPDNWLITPSIKLNNEASLSFWVRGENEDYPEEHFAVYLSTKSNVVSDFTDTLVPETQATGTYTQYLIDLSAYKGQNVYIAFRHFNCSDNFWLDLDDIEVIAKGDPTLVFNTTALDFGTIQIGSPAVQTVQLTGYNLTSNVKLSTEEPFSFSIDGKDFITSLDYKLENTQTLNLRVQYNPTAPGDNASNITITTEGVQDTMITLAGSAIDCNIKLPLVESFESDEVPAKCWSIRYKNETHNPVTHQSYAAATTGSKVLLFDLTATVSNYAQYLISPELPKCEKYLAFDHMKLSTSYDEYISVGYSKTTNDPGSFNWNNITSAASWKTFVDDSIPADVVYIAIKCDATQLGNAAIIDNVIIMERNACMYPSMVTITDIKDNQVSASWKSDAKQFRVSVVEKGATPSDAASTVVTDTNCTFTGLTALTNYDLYVKAECDANNSSLWYGPLTFTTAQTPAELPYTMGFEEDEADAANWGFANGTNHWVIGNAVAKTGKQSAYVSKDTASYSYINTTASQAWLYRDITFPDVDVPYFTISFDWKCIGETYLVLGILESYGDYGCAAIGTPFNVKGDDASLMNAVVLNNSMIKQKEWQHSYYELDGKKYAGTTQRLYFFWTNDNRNDAAADKGPLAIDNIEVLLPDFKTVSGTTTVLADGSKLDSVSITLTGKTTISTYSHDGEYKMLAENGKYLLTAKKDGYNIITDSIEVVDGGLVYDIKMTVPTISVDPTSVAATTVYRTNGTAKVTISNDGNGPLSWSTSTSYDEDGGKGSVEGISYEEYKALAGDSFVQHPESPMSDGPAIADPNAYVYNGEATRAENSSAICAFGGRRINQFKINDPSTATPTGLAFTDFMNTADYIGGKYYALGSSIHKLYCIDPSASTATLISPNMTTGAIAYNPADGQVYALKIVQNSSLYTIDVNTGLETKVVDLKTNYFTLCMTITNDGRFIVGCGSPAHGLYELNPKTGDMTKILDAGFFVNNGQDMSIDRETNTPYWAAWNDDARQGQLYKINLKDNTMSMVGTLPEQTSCFAITTTHGWLKYNPASGIVNAGEKAEVELVMDGWWAEEGHFTAVANFNSSNPSVGNVPVNVDFTIAKPECAAPENLKATLDNYTAIALTWDAPQADGIKGYNIYRDGGHDVYAFATTNSYSDTLIEYNDEHCYNVAAVYENGCVSLSTNTECVTRVHENVTLSGTVTDGTYKTPVADVAITFAGQYETYTATTDEQGHYEFEKIYADTYNVTATKKGYHDYEGTLKAVTGDNVLDFTMTKIPCEAVVTDLTAEAKDWNIDLAWKGTENKALLTYYTSGSKRVSSGRNEMGVCHLYTVEDIAEKSLKAVNKISFVPGTSSEYANYAICIWQGTSGTPVYTQEVTDVVASKWREVILTKPYVINPELDVRVGYIATDQKTDYVYITDTRNGVAGKGDLYTMSGMWSSLSAQNNGMNFNWAIKTEFKSSDVTCTILRDGKVVAENVEGTSYIDMWVPKGNHCYTVKPVCGNGEIGTESNEACSVVTEIDENSNHFEIYPNPATNVLNVSNSFNADKCEILNFLGQVVYSSDVNDNIFSVDINNLADGLYFIRLSGKNTIATQKFVKE